MLGVLRQRGLRPSHATDLDLDGGAQRPPIRELVLVVLPLDGRESPGTP